MVLILINITLLSYLERVEKSAAIGLIGAIVGYVFGGIYKPKEN